MYRRIRVAGLVLLIAGVVLVPTFVALGALRAKGASAATQWGLWVAVASLMLGAVGAAVPLWDKLTDRARRPKASAEDAGKDLAAVADQLAVAVAAQWEAEAEMRRLNDPYPLAVSWDPADPSLTDSWDSLIKLAVSGAGWPAPAHRHTWALGPEGLAGTGTDLVEVLARVPTGRLVVLGEPGAGKTMLMVRLVLDLLARRVGGGPVPILASVASWNPADQDLRDWLGAKLMVDYPALAAAPPAGMKDLTQAAALLGSGLILLILDGLDEIPEEVRGSAISRINDAVRAGEWLLVTCRSQQYRDAVRPVGGVEVTLRGAAAIQLCPLEANTVRNYLCDDAGGPVARARWAPVLAVLDTEAPAGQALTTPLMVGLARAIFNPRPGELAGTLRDPAELCSPALADRAAVESLLFDGFIPAAYRRERPGRWKVQDVEGWLVFLAHHLEYTIGDPDLAWWELPQALPTIKTRVTAEAEAIATLATADAAGRSATVVIEGGFLGALFIDTRAPDISRAVSPMVVLAQARRAAIADAAVPGVAIGVVVGVVAAFVLGPKNGIALGAAAILIMGIMWGFLNATWPWYEIARISLALHHRLPWRLMGFLADAHRRGVLRQAGAVYQLRHIELRHRLARRPTRL